MVKGECGLHTSNLGGWGNRDTSILTRVHKVQKVQRWTKYKISNNLCCFTIKSTMVAQNNKSTKVCKEKTLEKGVLRLCNSIVWGKTRSLVAKPNSTFLLFLFTFCSNNNGEDEDFLWQWLRQGIFYIFRSGVECFIDVFMNVLLFWCFDILFGIDWLYLFDSTVSFRFACLSLEP